MKRFILKKSERNALTARIPGGLTPENSYNSILASMQLYWISILTSCDNQRLYRLISLGRFETTTCSKN